ncbi:hypothetical protein MXB_4966 [Myxobolus squamalis]|nr:hypothetical protein MXB_4966 [Myxobolus squamalis]
MVLVYELVFIFFRPKFKKALYLVFYQIPLNPLFYSELIIMIQNNCEPQKSNQPVSISLFSKFDLMRLSNVIGGQKARMVIDNKLKSKFIFRPCG